jgi:hypothetical protein
VDIPTLTSTFFLTLLLLAGLFFFIRASVKERIQQEQFVIDGADESLLSQLQQYFEQRAYQVTAVDPAQTQVSFQGFVRPSWFLAIFLSLLAALGLSCLSLVLSLLFPPLGNGFLALTCLAPAAGIFYWKKAGRLEQIQLKVETCTEPTQLGKSLLTITAHRDELIQLRQTLLLKSKI